MILSLLFKALFDLQVERATKKKAKCLLLFILSKLALKLCHYIHQQFRAFEGKAVLRYGNSEECFCSVWMSFIFRLRVDGCWHLLVFTENIKMKETNYFVALHLHLAIASQKETFQLVCNSHQVQAGFRLLWRSGSQSPRNIQRYSIRVLQKFLDKQVSGRSQRQKAIQWQYKETTLGYMDFSNAQGTPCFRNLDLSNAWQSHGQALIDWTSLAKLLFNSTTKNRSQSWTYKNSGIFWKSTKKST